MLLCHETKRDLPRCGVCVTACGKDAISLVKKSTEVRPPKTREDLHDIIMAHKKSRWEKLKLAGRLVLDTLQTGHFRR